MIAIKIANKISKASENLPQNNSEQMSMIKKYLKKDTYLQRKDSKLLMIWDYYNSITLVYQKTINLLDNTPSQPSKYYSLGTYSSNNRTKFKTAILKSRLCNYTDVYTIVSGTITVPSSGKAVVPNIKKA